ncbi:DNA-binding transcriptional regulator CynR [compost metagenome]
MALLESRRVSTDCDSILLGTDEMLLCMHPNHPFASKPFLTADDLQEADMVVFDRTFLQRHLLDTFCADGKVTYRIAMQSNFVSLVIQAARDQVGMATLLRSVLQCTPGLVGVPFRPIQQMSFRLCWRSGEYLSPASKQLVDFASRAKLLSPD